MARDKIEQQKPQVVKTALLAATSRPGMLKVQLALGRLLPGQKIPGFVSRLISHQAPEANKPVVQHQAELPEMRDLPPVKGKVYMLEGCAMKLLYPRVHQATWRLLRRVGYEVREVEQGCCGALHAHNGHLDHARRLAETLVASMPEELPVVVNSAGCGSTMKEYGALLGEECPFAGRVKDLSEFLVENGLLDALALATGFNETVTYHDACHLAHGQRVTAPPRQLLRAIPNVRFVELAESDTCCGSAGIYNVTEPALARRLLDRKWSHIVETGAQIVASGNPGCHAWIAQAAKEQGATVKVMHTAEVLEAAFSGLSPFA
jgi:glycolate oxidase iron-sulfur subunit